MTTESKRIDDEKTRKKPHQKLLSFLFDCASSQNLRRTSTAVYTSCTTKDGVRQWVFSAELATWIVQQVMPPNREYGFYQIYTSTSSMPTYILDHLRKLPDERFPFLE